MRKFYIFNINTEFKNLTKTCPYNLFKTFENIYNLKPEESNYGISLYEKIASPINKIELNNTIFTSYRNNDHYTKYMNTHLYNNYYNDEKTKLVVGNAFITLETTSPKPEFFANLKNNHNFFVCDFQNQDYFWLESIA